MDEFMKFRFLEFFITGSIAIIILALIGLYFIINRIYLVLKAKMRIRKLKIVNEEYKRKKGE